MSQTHAFVCDVCGKKGPPERSRSGFWRDDLPKGWRSWTIRHPDKNDTMFGIRLKSPDLCSEDCLRKAMEMYLDGTPADAKGK